MTYQQKHVDALLANAAARMLHAGETAQQMRMLQRQGVDEAYCRMAKQITDDLEIATHCIAQSNLILLAEMGGTVGVATEGGLRH